MQPLNQFGAFEQRQANTSEFDVELDLILRSPFRKFTPWCQLPYYRDPCVSHHTALQCRSFDLVIV